MFLLFLDSETALVVIWNGGGTWTPEGAVYACVKTMSHSVSRVLANSIFVLFFWNCRTPNVLQNSYKSILVISPVSGILVRTCYSASKTNFIQDQCGRLLLLLSNNKLNVILLQWCWFINDQKLNVHCLSHKKLRSKSFLTDFCNKIWNNLSKINTLCTHNVCNTHFYFVISTLLATFFFCFKLIAIIIMFIYTRSILKCNNYYCYFKKKYSVWIC